MTDPAFACIILAAGRGTRMRSSRPKVLHTVAGVPMVCHVVSVAEQLAPERLIVVIGAAMDEVAAAVSPHPAVVQDPPRGTGDAVRVAGDALTGFTGDVVVLFGDTPLITPETIHRLLEVRRRSPDTAVAVLGMRPEDPGRYGRLVTGAGDELERIVEMADASPAERTIGLCNGGVMAIDGAGLSGWLDRLTADNVQGEFYLTDLVAIACADGRRARVAEAPHAELLGINSRAELAIAEAVMQSRLRAAAMAGGVTLFGPETIFLSADTQLAEDVEVGPQVVFGPGVVVERGARIRPFCHLEGVRVGADTVIGPFARLRPGAEIAATAHIGNFVEIKNTAVGPGAKINHLSYLGDATVGAKANIGAGTITCNYDGIAKHRTRIGDAAFIGSNTALVAPVAVGDGAIVGAGSVITNPVEADALAVARARQQSFAGWAARWRAGRTEIKK